MVLLSGCASWPAETIAEESVQQIAQVVDLGQTLDLRRTGHCRRISKDTADDRWSRVCYAPMVESWAAPIIGKHPRDAKIYEFKAAEMALHAGVTAIMVSRHWRTATRVWELVTIGIQTAADGRNAGLGVKIHF